MMSADRVPGVYMVALYVAGGVCGFPPLQGAVTVLHVVYTQITLAVQN
jgi:hypothetical protein